MAFLGLLLCFITENCWSQVYVTGKNDNNLSVLSQIIWKSEGIDCDLDSLRLTKRSVTSGGGYVCIDAEIAYSPNGKLYLFNDALDVYEPSYLYYYKKVFDFSNMSQQWAANIHGAVFDKNGILKISGEHEFFEYNPLREEGIILAIGGPNYIPSSDLAFLDGELIGTGLLPSDKSTWTKIYKYPEGDWGNPIPIIDLDTIYNFRLDRVHIYFKGIVPVSDYCDTTQVYALYGQYAGPDEVKSDSIYYWYVDENRVEAICEYKGDLDGTTSTTESLFSEPCIVYVDLDSNNSSKPYPQSFRDTAYCYLESVAISDEDVVVRSPFRVDSIRLCLTMKSDNDLEQLGIDSQLPTTIQSRKGKDGCLWLVNRGGASLEDFEKAIQAVRLMHLGYTFTPGSREIEVVGFAGGDSSEIVTSKIWGLDPIKGLGPDKSVDICEGNSISLTDSISIDSSISWSQDALNGFYTAESAGQDSVHVILEQSSCPNDTLFFDISVSPTPSPIEEEIFDICADDSINYSLPYDPEDFYAIWNKEDTTMNYVLRSGKLYDIEVYSKQDNGCNTEFSIATLEHTPNVISIDTLLCPEGSITFKDSTISEPGVYKFEGKDNSPKCEDIIELIVTEAPSVDNYIVPTPDSCIWDELTLTINMQDIDHVRWNIGNSGRDIKVSQPGHYSATWKYLDQCEYSSAIEILECEGSSLYIPNVFTPNGDGINDVFTVEGRNYQFISMKIYNRWGDLIYEARNEFEGWDGTYNGSKVNSGTYIYLIEYLSARGQLKTESGDITVIK